MVSKHFFVRVRSGEEMRHLPLWWKWNLLFTKIFLSSIPILELHLWFFLSFIRWIWGSLRLLLRLGRSALVLVVLQGQRSSIQLRHMETDQEAKPHKCLKIVSSIPPHGSHSFIFLLSGVSSISREIHLILIQTPLRLECYTKSKLLQKRIK